MIKISYTTRQGRTMSRDFADAAEARARLAVLDADEANTARVMPTDSGDVRFNYNAEARVIRIALTAIASGSAHCIIRQHMA